MKWLVHCCYIHFKRTFDTRQISASEASQHGPRVIVQDDIRGVDVAVDNAALMTECNDIKQLVEYEQCFVAF